MADQEAVAPSGATASPAALADGRGQARRVLLVAGALIALQALLRGWAALRGYFYIDDFTFIERALEHSAFDPDYLLHPYNNHVMPGSYLWVSALTALAPLGWTPVALVSTAVQALLAISCLLLLLELFGARWLILVPLTLMLFTPLNLPGFLWWAAALNQLPQQLAMVLALFFHVRYLRTGRTVHGLLGVAAVAGGLLFSEKTLLAVPLVGAVHLAYFTAGPLGRRVRDTMTQHAPVVGAYAVLCAAYLAYYVLEVPTPTREGGTGQDVVDVFGKAVFSGVLPSLLGGPWQWERIGFAGGLAAPGVIATSLSTVAVLGFIVWTSVRGRGATRAWLILLAYIGAVVALLALSRATIVGPVVGRELRYLTDIAVVAGICVGLAVIPLRPGRWPCADPLQRVAAPGTRAERTAWREQLGLPSVAEAPLVLTSVALLIISSFVSTVTYDRLWHPNPARAFVEGAKRQPAATAAVADGAVPPEVAWPLIAPYNTASRLLAPTAITFMRPGTASDRITALDHNGAPVEGGVSGVGAVGGPDAECGWRLGVQPVAVPLTADLYEGVHIVRIGYLSAAETSLQVTAGDTTGTVPVHKGLGAAYLVVRGAPHRVEVAPTAGGSSVVCSRDIRVGRPVPRSEAP
ncbi:MAG: hypothetical protein LWW86_06260 [Micrococcales bacterium]|nr:hypothetical protein [Micrococcales bacterium]